MSGDIVNVILINTVKTQKLCNMTFTLSLETGITHLLQKTKLQIELKGNLQVFH